MVDRFNDENTHLTIIHWRWCLGALGALATLLLIYASVIPLQYQPLDWEQSLDRWYKIPWLKLGIYNRADWIANGLVVVPVAFLLTGGLSYRKRSRRFLDGLSDIFSALLVLTFLFVLVFGIELVQVWFPPRTVSWNDILAGWIGAICGATVWLVCGNRLVDAVEFLFGIENFEDRLFAFALLGCVGGILYSVYPLDIILTGSEWNEKKRLGRVQWGLLAHSNSTWEWAQGLIVSAMRMIPFGVLGLRLRSSKSRWVWVLGWGVVLELVQLPIFAKFSSTADVVMGWIGGAAGLLGAQPNKIWYWIARERWLWIIGTVSWSGILIAAFLARWEGWVVDPQALQLRWSEFFTYPLLRYYYTSEYSALTNLLGKLASFAVLGALTTGCLIFPRRTLRKETYRSSLFWSLVICIPVGLTIEFSQIYLLPFIGDLSDVGIYAVGAVGGAWLMMYLVKGIGMEGNSQEPQNPSAVSAENLKEPNRPVGLVSVAQAIGGASLIAGGAIAFLHPGWPWIQILLLVGCAAIVYRFPNSFPWLFIVSLIAGDAYPITGQLVLQEYDSCLLGILSGWLLSCRGTPEAIDPRGFKKWISERFRHEPALFSGLALLATSGVISFAIGMIRLPTAPWGDQLSVYFTQWNAIRVGKGILWGLIFSTMIILSRFRFGRFGSQGLPLAFLRGCSLAGGYVGVFVMIERALFPGLMNFGDVYRATGPFFTMHIGDQHLDAFLVLILPWVWVNATYPQCTKLERLCCSTVLVLLAYGAFSTMSRATMVVMLIQIAVLVFLSWMGKATRVVGIKTGIAFAVFGLMLLIGLFLSMQTKAIHGRFSTLVPDWNGRVKHWSMIVHQGTSGLGGVSIGHGLGTLPSLVSSEFGRPVPPLSWQQAQEGETLRGQIRFLGTWPIYLERWAGTKPDQLLGDLDLQLTCFASTSAGEKEPLEVQSMLVEKSVLESFSTSRLATKKVYKSWTPLTWEENKDPSGNAVAQDGSLSRWRPKTFGISVTGQGALILQNPTGLEIGGIDARSSYPWFFTCDDHMVWRAKNFLVHAYYEQGIAGVAAWGILLIGGLWRGVFGESLFDRSLAVTILGFIGVGFFGTLIDTPWIVALLLGLLSIRLKTCDPQ